MPIVSGGGGGGGTPFNGGTITGALTVHPSTDADALVVIPHDSGDDALRVKDAASNTLLEITDGSLFDFSVRDVSGRWRVLAPTELLKITQAGIAFFGASPAAQQTLTSATATPEQIALALEASTLMTGT